MANYADDDYFANLPDDVVKEAQRPPAAWPEGNDYIGTIIEAAPYQAEGDGKFPCVKLTVNVANPEGRTKRMNSWVLSKNPSPGAVGAAINFLKAVGLTLKEYRNPAQLVGLSGPVVVEKQTGTDGNEYNRLKGFTAKRR